MFGSKNNEAFNLLLEKKKAQNKEKKDAPVEHSKNGMRFFSNLLDEKEDYSIPRVYSGKNKDAPEDALAIDRTSKYGNPYTAKTDGTREEVIKKFADYLFHNPELLDAVRKELKGKSLLCHCSPLSCHGDVLLLVANPELDFRNKFTNYVPDAVVEPVIKGITEDLRKKMKL